VTLVEWPVPQGQVSAYRHWYETFRAETEWVSFLDLDEFIVPTRDNTLVEWLKRRPRSHCVICYWKVFGTSGQLRHDDQKLVIEQYTISWDKFYAIGKVLLNTDYDIAKFDHTTHHMTQVKVRWCGRDFVVPPVNEFGRFVIGENHRLGHRRSAKDFTIQVNHYWSKALEVYLRKAEASGDVFFSANPKRQAAYFLWHELKNRSTDHKISRFVVALKARMTTSTGSITEKSRSIAAGASQ
jgi:hypothetical protein